MSKWIAPTWGIVGLAALLIQAVVRMVPRVIEAFGLGLSPWQWVVVTAWVAWMAHAEGVRGFHRRFSPRAVARALTLRHPARWWHAVLAPIYCMGMIHAPRRTKLVAWGVTCGVLVLVMIVSRLPTLWRGIVDAGVVAGLGIGLASLLGYAVHGLRGKALPVAPALPAEPEPGSA